MDTILSLRMCEIYKRNVNDMKLWALKWTEFLDLLKA